MPQHLAPKVFAGPQPYGNIGLDSWTLVALHCHSEKGDSPKSNNYFLVNMQYSGVLFVCLGWFLVFLVFFLLIEDVAGFFSHLLRQIKHKFMLEY